MAIWRIFTLITALALSLLSLATQAEASSSRERLSLDNGWLFHLGDIAPPAIKTHGASYANAKAGNAPGAAGLDYDDSDWRKLDLPHDWAVEGPFDPKENISQGYRPRGIGWYRRYLRVDPADRGKHFEIQFDAIATHATVWVNGNEVLHNWSGYNASRIDLTPYLRYGDALNTIAVRVDANAMEGWWYEGAGIYRHTWLVKRSPLHIITDGLDARPRDMGGDKWQLPVVVTLNNSGEQPADAQLQVQLFDPAGKLVATKTTKAQVPVLAQRDAQVVFTLKKPQLWSLQQTHLYRVQVSVNSAGKLQDQTSLSTGFRRIRFDASQGFFLNDQQVKLQGVCIHQDHAGVGVAVPDAIWEYRLRRLKELGVNAIRFAHNAPAAEVLDMVDRMGFLVMDENRNFNPSPDYLAQLEWMLRRDRHHPGIILWSVFNEEPVQSTEVGYQMVRRMTAAVKALDDTRPVTAAMNGGFFTELNVSHAVDVVGFNYQVKDYDRFHQLHPNTPITSSEDTSAFMTRGEFLTDPGKNTVASYDDDFAYWGNSHRDAWEAIAKRDFIAGGFVWTGFDYRGEPTPHEWPSVSSYFGIMDLNGFAKTAYYIHQVQWIKDRPLVYIAPHWNWAGKEGQAIRVLVMSNAARVQLWLNGKLLGEQQVDPYRMNEFAVNYAPGRLEAVAFNAEQQEVARSQVETTGPAVSLDLVADRASLANDGRDAMPITVRALDAQGRQVPLASDKFAISVTGAGKLIGHGNGDPTSHEDEKGMSRSLFHGLAQLIVQSRAGSTGSLQISVTAPGLKSAQLSIPVRPAAAIPSVAKAQVVSLLHDWRIAPASVQRPDPNQQVADNDMNTWGWGQVPTTEIGLGLENFPTNTDAKPSSWHLFRTSFTPRQDLANGKGHIRFRQITGRAEIWLDGKLIGQKTISAPGEIIVGLPAGQGRRQLNVLISADPEQKVGIEGLVIIEPGN